MLNMKRLRFRLSALLWLVAIVAAVLWGVRYWQDREARPKISIFRTGKEFVYESPPEFEASEKFEVYHGQEPRQGRGKRRKTLIPIIAHDGACAGLRFNGHSRPEAAGSER